MIKLLVLLFVIIIWSCILLGVSTSTLHQIGVPEHITKQIDTFKKSLFST